MWSVGIEVTGDEVMTPDRICELAAATLGVAVKYREDAERVRKALDAMLSR
jgi:hypothetical protein